MFPQTQRITALEFDSILKKGRTTHSSLFSLCFVPSNKIHVAVVASKKVSKKAVIRNRNKRRVRHALKSLIKKGSSGYFVFFIKKDLTSIKYPTLLEELKPLVSKAVL